MSAQGAHAITAQFEQALCDYTGAPYAVALDNCSNAIFLALYYELHIRPRVDYNFKYEDGKPVIICPSNTYPSTPFEIIHAGAKVEFWNNGPIRKGEYRLMPTRVWDSALTFTHKMFKVGQIQCLSFTGPYKHLKLGKGGAILTDDPKAAMWFKRARFSGRQEMSYHEDNFDFDGGVVGWNFYMMPEISARGLQLMLQFFMTDGTPRKNDDLSLPYPDLSKFKIFKS